MKWVTFLKTSKHHNKTKYKNKAQKIEELYR